MKGLGFLDEELRRLDDEGRRIRLRVLEGAQEPVSTIDGRRVINLTSNNYLALTTHPKVMLAANFNEWKPVTCKKQKDGTYSVTVNLPPGTYEYKFIVDQEWVVDPDNPTWARNSYGTFNSVAHLAPQ